MRITTTITQTIAKCSNTETSFFCCRLNHGTLLLSADLLAYPKLTLCSRQSCLHCTAISTKVGKNIYYWPCFRYKKLLQGDTSDNSWLFPQLSQECARRAVRDNHRIHFSASSEHARLAHDDNIYAARTWTVVPEIGASRQDQWSYRTKGCKPADQSFEGMFWNTMSRSQFVTFFAKKGTRGNFGQVGATARPGACWILQELDSWGSSSGSTRPIAYSTSSQDANECRGLFPDYDNQLAGSGSLRYPVDM